MPKLGILIELKDNKLKKTNFELLSLAADFQGDKIAFVFADNDIDFSAELAGIGQIVLIRTEGKEYHPEIYSATLAHMIREMEISDLIASGTARGRDLIPRTAAKLGFGMIQDCLSINLNGHSAVKPLYSGKLLAEYLNESPIRLYTLRPNAIPVSGKPEGPAPQVINGKLVEVAEKLRIIEIQRSSAAVIDLSEAEIIISGGRGLKSSENLALLAELAQILGAALGASRAAVDAEIAPPETQVGQTGKIVSPKLYIACGISGAIQHFVGMKTSKVIVAINKDPEAPIFKKADYGIVADLFEAVPLLQQELRKII